MRGEFREQDTGQTGLQEASREERRLVEHVHDGQGGQDSQQGASARQGSRQTCSQASRHRYQARRQDV
jgi:hypothetical protein